MKVPDMDIDEGYLSSDPSDVEMYITPTPSAPASHLNDSKPDLQADDAVSTKASSDIDEVEHPEEGVSDPQESMDLLGRVRGMHRLLDLIYETGSGGIVDKVIIAQDSIRRLANNLQPGSYRSLTQVDFRALDNHVIKPVGVYGSISRLVEFLHELGRVEDETAALLLAERDERSGHSRPVLRPGLYLLDAREVQQDLMYIVFWPEDETWLDGSTSSVARNRVTFMRYLTKLCDQLVCLISDEHSANLVWKEEGPAKTDGDEEEDTEVDESMDDYDRVYTFAVEQTNEEEEGVEAKPGFKFHHSSIHQTTNSPLNLPDALSLDLFRSQIVVGDTSQALLKCEYIAEELKTLDLDEVLAPLALKDRISPEKSSTIILGDKISHEGLRLLLEHGLWDRLGKLKDDWNDHSRVFRDTLESERKAQRSQGLERINGARQLLKRSMPLYMIYQAVKYYPLLKQDVPILFREVTVHEPGEKLAEELNVGFAEIESFFQANQSDKQQEIDLKLKTLETHRSALYDTLKRRIRRVDEAINTRDWLSEEDIQKLVDLIPTKGNWNKEFRSITRRGDEKAWHQKLTDGVTTAMASAVTTVVNAIPGAPHLTADRVARLPDLPHQNDIEFVHWASQLEADRPVFLDAIQELRRRIREIIVKKIGEMASIPDDICWKMQQQFDREIQQDFDQRKEKEEVRAFAELKDKIREHLASQGEPGGRTITIKHVTNQKGFGYYGPPRVRIEGTISVLKRPGLKYTLWPLEIKDEDRRKSSDDPDHVCMPVIRPTNATAFELRLDTNIKFACLAGNDQCIVVLESAGELHVHFDSFSTISQSISRGGFAKRLHLTKMGANCLFAFDETKKLLAIAAVNDSSVYLHVYSCDPQSKTINSRGSALNLTKWWNESLPHFTHLVFVPGTEELVMIEKSGIVRVFSMITDNFRPSTLELEGSPSEAYSSPDGSSLITVHRGVEDSRPRIRCFHWTSFGSNEGIAIDWPNYIPLDAPLAVSSVGNRNIPHIIFLHVEEGACHSLHLHITKKSSEFAFRSSNKGDQGESNMRHSVNNSLIDCHAEVWTRFPVQAAIKNEPSDAAIRLSKSITFVSTAPEHSFQVYFSTLIRQFETKTRKPTKGVLKKLKVSASEAWSPTFEQLEISQTPIGEWLVSMFCLIPIHLAITSSNRFNPLKDGVVSPEFERSLLGANVAQIAESLSFGWYESIFNSYLAKKPVKVVTSMGEQSVGKSFALNHLVDTSFAGSAMRCTEGVWLSVTLTKACLVVSMDFEGVHSIERSAQEDTLLVLLNSAISNFVLFRNNFAISRDIAGLFTSFQSCTTVLDPAANPQLFNSTLGIIIKDVIDSDTKEIVNEFKQKFQRIVQQERADNFISKLHKGKLDIIPWPVIESSRFYELFGALKLRLERQPFTHHHAGAFLLTLKMLMAKLKANDWGALDQNLAVQRADQISHLLVSAMSLGTTDPDLGEPLKNFDTDETLEAGLTMSPLYLEASHAILPPEFSSISACLAYLRAGYPRLEERYNMDDGEYYRSLQAYLQAVVESRVEQVRRWITVNTERFGPKAEITALLHTFDAFAKEMQLSVLLCGSKCSQCGLICLEHKQHNRQHDCKTSHLCPRVCSFVDQHQGEIPECGMPAGHEGRHVCKGAAHLCDRACTLHGKEGCLSTCSKPADHDDEEDHRCAARVHACGQPCSLRKPDGSPLCDRPCIIDCQSAHNRHECDRALSCPIKCQLCKSYCSVGDHFHALDDAAIHLCGQSHVCNKRCQRPGICEIATTPQSIESTFTGKHTQYQFTKYSQEAQRLPCVVPIEPGELKHKGQHVHSLDPAAFHYCQEKCKYCGYYCTLPLGHPQKEHETSHGSMSQTQWVLDGGDDAVLELEGRKYATGDSGAPMLCSMVCKALHRHSHLDTCRADTELECSGADVQHRKSEKGNSGQDWITHRLYWARSGFKDPYTNVEQAEFDLCDHRCGGDEHDASINTGAQDSYCVLPLFHPPADASQAPSLGHISQDGHAYRCKNPALMQRSFHIFFVLDHSGSMTATDKRPLSHSPATARIVQRANNRFGAVVSSIYGFWTARDKAVRTGSSSGARRDAYTIIPFESTASVALSNDMTSDPDQLLNLILSYGGGYGGTNFTHALETVRHEMERSWSTERSPIVIFLSDGECSINDSTIYDLCRTAVRLGKPLGFHTVSFGADTYSQSLRRMAAIADEVYATAPRDPLAPPVGSACTFSNAVDTIQLASTFMSIAQSLQNTRAALSRI